MKLISMADRRAEIPRMIEILDKHKDWKSLTFFQYKGGNADLLKPLTKIRIARRLKAHGRIEFSLTIGTLNYAERVYVKKFQAEDGLGSPGPSGRWTGLCWPDDFFERFPKKKAA